MAFIIEVERTFARACVAFVGSICHIGLSCHRHSHVSAFPGNAHIYRFAAGWRNANKARIADEASPLSVAWFRSYNGAE